jgi:hypothetical protein
MGEVDAGELEELIKARKLYGRVIEYYRRYGKKPDGTMRPALVFCRTVKAAGETARQFRDAGFNFESIDGAMAKGTQRAILDGIKSGKLQGLTACEILNYGVDRKNIEYLAMLRPTVSRALYFQMVGRGLRISPGKTECVVVDHVNNLQNHQDPEFPGTPLFYLDRIAWAFHGVEKKKKAKPLPMGTSCCPYNDYAYCPKSTCAGCTLRPAREKDYKKELVVDVQLVEKKAPPNWQMILPEEKQEIQDKISSARYEIIEALKTGTVPHGPVAELVEICKTLDRNIMWIYWHIVPKEQKTICVPLLWEIQRCAGFKPGWVYFKIKELQKNRVAEIRGEAV